MECRFLDLKLIGAAESISSNKVLGFRHLLGAKTSSSLFGSCRGGSVKASYSSLSSKFNGIAAETASLFINGADLSLLTRSSRILEASDDEYEGIVVDSERLPESRITFVASLRASISHWRAKGKKGVWLKLPKERSDLVPSAIKEGFEYHHAEKGYVMLTFWIPEGPCLLPSNASHQVGVGGFVINDKNEVLVVQETYCGPDYLDCWKLPTGFIQESEEIYDGAVREVKEETGIETEFVEVIAFRHAHNVAFEKSDLFFICMLRPLSTQIKVDDQEIQAAKWMPLEEFVQQPVIQHDSMFSKIISICKATLNKRYCGLAAHSVVSKFDGKSSSLYYNITKNDQGDHTCITK